MFFETFIKTTVKCVTRIINQQLKLLYTNIKLRIGGERGRGGGCKSFLQPIPNLLCAYYVFNPYFIVQKGTFKGTAFFHVLTHLKTKTTT